MKGGEITGIFGYSRNIGGLYDTHERGTVVYEKKATGAREKV